MVVGRAGPAEARCSVPSGGAGRRVVAGGSVVASPHPSRVAIALPHSSNRRRRCSPARTQRGCEHSRDGRVPSPRPRLPQRRSRTSGSGSTPGWRQPPGPRRLPSPNHQERRDRAPTLASRSRQPCTSPQPTARTVQPRSPAAAPRPHSEIPTSTHPRRRSQSTILTMAGARGAPATSCGARRRYRRKCSVRKPKLTSSQHFCVKARPGDRRLLPPVRCPRRPSCETHAVADRARSGRTSFST